MYNIKNILFYAQVDKRVARAIGEQPLMEHAGANVKLSISSTSLSLRTLDSGQLVATHDMPRISFASGGDTVSYILCTLVKILYTTSIEE